MHHPLSMPLWRPHLSALLLGGLLLMGGCKTLSPAPDTPESRAASLRSSFLASFNHVLGQGVRRVNLDGWVGGVSLRTVINRQNQVVSCIAEALPEYPLERFPDNRQLVSLMEKLCWDTVFPRVEPMLFASVSGAVMEVVVPLVFSRPGKMPTEEQKVRETVREYNAREEYFWQQLFVGATLDSIGSARISGAANAQGQVQRCQVELTANPMRLADFKPDPGLAQRLQSACANLDLRQMPGFFIAEPMGGRFLLELDYSPWKGGPKQP
ncbi:hypothetical protein GV819_28590 [Pseudomonas sp. Fl5BN2]|uniref:hypothetical protein n=1 Tax=Pseudomonas sp. Fl5BN2 TaxID=2697652 RepID=UPI0013775334|nr:hypothetical protein [Pseudomonas sp. Fl5BN2]NBF06245.1 hypothetical protein [Pseudomonas sp. Fl5BN2]